jgi:hypothetical protein
MQFSIPENVRFSPGVDTPIATKRLSVDRQPRLNLTRCHSAGESDRTSCAQRKQ